MADIKSNGSVGPSGALAHVVTRDVGLLRDVQRPPLAWRVRNFFKSHLRSLPALVTYRVLGRIFSLVYIESALFLKVIKRDGTVIDYGCVGRRVVTTVGAGFLVDAWQNSVEMETMKYHGFGTGTTAEAVGDTGIETEFTTQYAVNSTRPTGDLGEGASANIFQTVATFSPDSGGTLAVTEHGILSSATVGAGVLWDRTKFSAVNLDSAAGDSMVSTYQATFTAGS